MIYAELSFSYHLGEYTKGWKVRTILDELEECNLVFQGVEFKPGKMIVQVMLAVDSLDAPRHEGEGEELVEREVEKTGWDCSIRVCHGTEYVDEQKPYRPQMTIGIQLRAGEA